MNIDELLRAGNEILDDVMEAIDSNNYSDLGQKIREKVREVAVDNGWQSGNAAGQQARRQNSAGAQQGTSASYGRGGGTQQNTAWRAAQNAGGYYRQIQARKSNFLLRRVGRSGSTVRTVLGGLGLLAFGIPAIICLAALIVEGGGAMLAGTIIFGLMTAGAGWLLRGGIRGNKLVSRYYEYGRQMGSAEYVSIPDFAAQIGRPEKEVRADLLDMMHKGYLPQARMDAQQKTLILTDHAYELYQQAENSRVQRTAEEAARKKAEEAEKRRQDAEQKKRESEPQEKREIREILERGNAYIRKVRDVNDRIPDTEEMSTKLYRLEEIMHRIFEQVKKQPASAAGLRRFMDYYLPTTEKLLDAYVELDKQPVHGDNITKTKREIDEAMDVINDAFENLLNSLFENMAWDISSDISVMKTMLAQDGLTKKGSLFDSLTGGTEHREKEPVSVYTVSPEEQEKKELFREQQ